MFYVASHGRRVLKGAHPLRWLWDLTDCKRHCGKQISESTHTEETPDSSRWHKKEQPDRQAEVLSIASLHTFAFHPIEVNSIRIRYTCK